MHTVEEAEFSIGSEEIKGVISVLASEIMKRYPNGCTICLILEGAEKAGKDLRWALRKKAHLYLFTEILARSYVNDKQQAGVAITSVPSRYLLSAKNVVLFDDVVDSGKTMRSVAKFIAERFVPNEIRAMALCVKGELPEFVLPVFEGELPWVGFKLPKEGFIVGYGMDYNGKFRDLDVIRPLTEAEKEEGKVP